MITLRDAKDHSNCRPGWAHSFASACMLLFLGISGLALSAPTPEDLCGAPKIKAKLDRATFVWKDCDNTERWHLRVMGGGSTVMLTVSGAIASAGGVMGITPVSIETTDVLDTVTVANRLAYSLKVSGAGFDGFDFGVAAQACFTPGGPSSMPVYLGVGRIPLSTAGLNLTTAEGCDQPIDTDGDGLTDAEEAILGTDPSNPDTDGGGLRDDKEIAANSNPLDPNDDFPLGSWSVGFEDVTASAGVQGSAVESWGGAWGDFNADGYPDLFTSNHRVAGRLLRNNGNGTFSDVSVTADPAKAILNSLDSHAGIWADVDNDGDEDLTIAVGPLESYLLINANGVFRDERAVRGLTIGFKSESRMPVYLDLNNDGLLDLKLINWKEPANQDTFFVQDANHNFAKVAGSSGLRCLRSDWAQLADVNGSGLLEILCGDQNGFPATVYDLSSGAGVRLSIPKVAFGIDAISGDFDGDLRPDFVVIRGIARPNEVVRVDANRLETQLLINNSGQYTLTLQTSGLFETELSTSNWDVLQTVGGLSNVYIGASGYHPNSGTLSLDPVDSLNQGVQSAAGRSGLFIGFDPSTDLWRMTFASTNLYSYGYFTVVSDQPIGNFSLSGLGVGMGAMTPVLLHNSPNGLVDATDASGLSPVRCVSGVAGDFDNDMDLDLVMACRGGAQNLANVAFENLGNGTFRRVAVTGAEGPVGPALASGAGTSDSVVAADYDLDGFLDLFVTNGLNMRPKGIGGDNQLFHNTGNANHWLELDLVGVATNRDGLGAKAFVTAGGISQYREQNGGYHRWSQNHSRIHVGLGTNVQADITVQWPNGTAETFSAVLADALYIVTEGQGIAPFTAAPLRVPDQRQVR